MTEASHGVVRHNTGPRGRRCWFSYKDQRAAAAHRRPALHPCGLSISKHEPCPATDPFISLLSPRYRKCWETHSATTQTYRTRITPLLFRAKATHVGKSQVWGSGLLKEQAKAAAHAAAAHFSAARHEHSTNSMGAPYLLKDLCLAGTIY